MSSITRNLVLLLAIAVVISPLRAAWHGHSVTAHDGHVHVHVHAHDGVTPTHAHAHAHYHHHGEAGDEDPAHHDRVLDHAESGPMVFWTAPRGVTVDPPPAVPGRLAGAFGVSVDAPAASPLRRANPPPKSPGHLQHLHLARTTVLRL